MIKLRIDEDTDTSKSKPAFFQLKFGKEATQQEKDNARQLVLRNNTATGEVQLEGSIKQLRKLLRSHLVVKPACLFDKSIRILIKVSYA